MVSGAPFKAPKGGGAAELDGGFGFFDDNNSDSEELDDSEEFDDGEEDKRPPQKNTQSTNRKSNEMSSFGLSETDFDDVDNVIELVEQEPGQFDSLYITFVQVNSSHS